MRTFVEKAAWVGRTTAMAMGLAVALALVLGVATVALAAVPGDPFRLGQVNSISAITQLVGSKDGAMLRIDNNAAAANAHALLLDVNANKAPMKVNATAGTATNLSADELDGKSSEQFANSAHQHSGGDINGGTVEADRIEDGAGSNLNADQLDGMEPNQLPGSIAGMAVWSGLVYAVPGEDTSVWSFAGPQATVTTTAGQRLVGAAEAPLALATGTASQDFRYNLCYQPSAGGSLSEFVSGGYSIGHVTPTRVSWTATSGTGLIGAGTWKVGFCVRNGGPAPINNNDYVNGWVQVINNPAATPAAASKVATSNVQGRR